jgi:hypothetical protein
MAKIFVPAVLPGEEGRTIESDGNHDVKIRTYPAGYQWPWGEPIEEGTIEFDRGGMTVFMGPGHLHELPRTQSDHDSRLKDSGQKNTVRAVEEGLREIGFYNGPRVHGEEDGLWGRKGNAGLEKLLVLAQMQSGEEISGAYTAKTRETLRNMAAQGAISPKLVDALDKLDATGQLSHMYGPKNIQAVVADLRANPITLMANAAPETLLPASRPLTSQSAKM